MRIGFNRSYNSSRLLFQQKVWRLLFLTSSCYIHFFSWRQSQQQAKSPNDFTTTTLYLTVAPSLLRVALFANICYIIQTSLLFADLLRGGVSSCIFFFFFDVEGQWARGQWYWGVAGRVTFQKTSWLSGIFGKIWKILVFLQIGQSSCKPN